MIVLKVSALMLVFVIGISALPGKPICPKSMISCGNSLCIPKKWTCDGEHDCPGGEDEDPIKCAGKWKKPFSPQIQKVQNNYTWPQPAQSGNPWSSPTQEYNNQWVNPTQTWGGQPSPVQQQGSWSLQVGPWQSPVQAPGPWAQPVQTTDPWAQPVQTPDPWYQPAQTPDPWVQPVQTPDPWAQPSQTPDPWYQPVQTPDPWAQPAPKPDPWVQPVPTPDPWYQPVQTPDPWVQPVQTPAPWFQPVQTPDPWVQPAQTPDPWAQTWPKPNPQPATLECPLGKFSCNGACLPNELRCNGIKNCFDGSDEAWCPTKTTQPAIRECTSQEVRCFDGKCISKLKLCDGKQDCSNWEDEFACGLRQDKVFTHNCLRKCLGLIEPVLPTNTSTTCPSGYTFIYDRCLKVIAYPPKPWNEARKSCLKYNAALVEIDNGNFFLKLQSYLNQPKYESYSYWTGAFLNPRENKWIWSNSSERVHHGAPLWSIGDEGNSYKIQPSGGPNENCGLLQNCPFQYLNDEVCNKEFPYICQRNAQSNQW